MIQSQNDKDVIYILPGEWYRNESRAGGWYRLRPRFPYELEHDPEDTEQELRGPFATELDALNDDR